MVVELNLVVSDGSGSYYSYSGDYSDYTGDYYTDDYYSDDYYDSCKATARNDHTCFVCNRPSSSASDYSDYTGSYYEYSTDSQYISEFTRERLNYLPLKDWFSDLPEPAVARTQRQTRDPYFLAIQQNIVNLRLHIRQIQVEEQQLLLRFCKHLLIVRRARERERATKTQFC